MPIALGIKPGHDGALACISDGQLLFSFESEKDSFRRFSDLTTQTFLEALAAAPEFPDVVACGGWYKLVPGAFQETGGGYRGLEPGQLSRVRLLGHETTMYAPSHERTHILSAVVMSPFEADDLAVLVWEGIIGSLYRWRDGGRVVERREVLDQPGARFAALFALADPTFPDSGEFVRSDYAGKLMALAGFADDQEPTDDSRSVVGALLKSRSLYPFHKYAFRRSPLYNCGVTEPEVCRTAKYLSDQLFGIYYTAATEMFPPGLPLVISGGCGLNCEWNSAFRSCGHFSQVFVPPCPNDTGSAIGAAADALLQLGEPPRLAWDVYSGQHYVDDVANADPGWTVHCAAPDDIARRLNDGNVVAWVHGRCEIGPRALGNRSLLASARYPTMHDELNRIKQREPYRPIAPVCLEEDLGEWFDDDTPDPHMLYFRRGANPEAIPAVIHADGTARVQSVNAASNRDLFELLISYRGLTGIGVLCNTSLNFSGRGFINRTSDLLQYCSSTGVNDAVVGSRWFRRSG